VLWPTLRERPSIRPDGAYVNWYYTQPGTKKRVPLFDEQGQRIRGKESKEAAELALAREKLSWETEATATPGGGEWLVARACSDYIQYCERGLALTSPGYLNVTH